MTAEAIAEIAQGRRIGSLKWLARCPAHADTHPSLQISQGHSGTLLKCWAGCRTEEVVSALGLLLADLFDDAGLTPAQHQQATRQHRERDAEHKSAHHSATERNRELHRLERSRDELGGLLALRPHDGEVRRLFNGVLDELHEREASELVEDGPLRCEPLAETPAWIASELSQIFAPAGARAPDPDALNLDEVTEWPQLQTAAWNGVNDAA